MGGGGGSPPPPDPVATAQAQTAMNVETARVQNQLNRVNQVGPDGSITYAQAPGTSTLDQSAYEAAKQRMLATMPLTFDEEGIATPGQLTPEQDAALRGEFTKYTPSDQWTMTTQLSPEQQQIYDLGNQAKITYGQAANEQLQGVRGILGTAFDGQPYINIQGGGLAGTAGALDRSRAIANQDFNSQPYLNVGDQSIARAGAAAAQPINTDYNAIRQQAIDAANSRLQPDFRDQEDALRTRLLNTGISEGSEAWNRAYRQMNNAQNDSRQQTLLNAENLAGQAIQQTGALRQIPIGEAQALQGMATQGLSNQGIARQIPLSEQQQIAQLSGAFGNQASQGLQSALTVRNQPLNEAAALLTGSSVQTPQLQQTPGSTVAPVDYGGMVQNSYAGQVAEANRKAQIGAANTGAAAGAVGALGSAAIMAAVL